LITFECQSFNDNQYANKSSSRIFRAEQAFREAEIFRRKNFSPRRNDEHNSKHKELINSCRIKKKISKLREDQQKKKSAGKHESEYHIEKEGAGRAVLIGFENVGKSSIVAALTHATPKISESPFTTWQPLPGMMGIEDIQVQLIDTPPLNKEHSQPELFDLIRSSDLILIVVDLQTNSFQQLDDSLNLLNEHKSSQSNGKRV